MKHFLTLLIAVLSLLPSTMKAAGNKVITSLDLTIPVPQAGMTVQEGEELKLTAAARPLMATWSSRASPQS